MARTQTTAQTNAAWLASVQTFKTQLETYKTDMESIKDDFQQISQDVNALRQRAEDCGQGIYVYQSWNLFSRAMVLQTLLDDTEKLDRVREIMRQGLGIPDGEYQGQYDSDFDFNINAGNISDPDPERKASAPKVYPTEGGT